VSEVKLGFWHQVQLQRLALRVSVGRAKVKAAEPQWQEAAMLSLTMLIFGTDVATCDGLGTHSCGFHGFVADVWQGVVLGKRERLGVLSAEGFSMFRHR
jgi:hypothetical protein